jgi:hypothetical protein
MANTMTEMQAQIHKNAKKCVKNVKKCVKNGRNDNNYHLHHQLRLGISTESL